MPRTPEQSRSFGRHSAPRDTGGIARKFLQTMPIVLASSLALTMTAPIAATAEPIKRTPKTVKSAVKLPRVTLPAAARTTVAAAAAASTVTAGATVPSKYTVIAGDTVSSIAAAHGLSTASVLALNGLGWKSLIFPGQVLSLGGSAAAPAAPAAPVAAPVASPGSYTIVSGDTAGAIAARFGVSTQSLLSANGLSWSSIIYPGQVLAIPGAAPAAAPAPAPAPALVASTTTYTIAAGDTVSSIAAKFGVPIASVLESNGLNLSSVIYVGRTLTIVGSPTIVVAGAQQGLTAEQTSIVQTIIAVGRSLGVPDRGIVVALAAAAQESTLRNLDYGDRDSVGVFQQRPSIGWGSVAQLTTVDHAARLFFGGPSNPNAGITRGLLDIPGWQGLSVTAAAQAVQISAYPDAYAKWEGPAATWLATFG